MESRPEQALFGMKLWAGRRRVPFWLFTRAPGSTRERTVSRRTQLTIEGYPRSGNSFAEFAFRHAQPTPVRLAEHHHKSAHVLRSVRLGVPTLVVIREPEAAVSSTLMFYEWMRPERALNWYASFYRDLIPVRDQLVLADFREVTTDFGATIRRVNDRFGTEFSEFSHTQSNVESVFRRLDEQSRLVGGGDLRVSRPADAREQRRDVTASRLRDGVRASLLEAAIEVYEELTAVGLASRDHSG